METTTPPTTLDTRFTEFNIRNDIGTPHFVRLHDNATRRFETYARAFAPAMSHGSGVGGLLLGTIELADQWSITIQDFTPVFCEHRRGGRSPFLDCPARCFQNAVRRATHTSKKNRMV